MAKKSKSKVSPKKKHTVKKQHHAVKKVAKVVKAKKAVHKKVVKLPRSKSRARVYNLTRELPETQFFVLANGRPVKHVAELASVLDTLEDHVFYHHVTADRNDFHNWIKDVFNDVELAKKVAGVDKRDKLQLVIYRHLAGHED